MFGFIAGFLYLGLGIILLRFLVPLVLTLIKWAWALLFWAIVAVLVVNWLGRFG